MERPTKGEVNKGLTAIRKQVTTCGRSLTYNDLYREAEALQHMVHDFKLMVASGGTWEEHYAQVSSIQNDEKVAKDGSEGQE